MVAPLRAGDQVAVIPQEGNADHGVVVGRCFSNAALPPGSAGADMVFRSSAGASITMLTSGNVVIRDPSGSTFTMTNNGSIVLGANLTVNGDINSTGTISDLGGVHGSLGALRSDYDAHTHVDSRGGTTSVPSLVTP